MPCRVACLRCHFPVVYDTRTRSYIAFGTPPAAAWEANDELPRFSVALHGAAELLGVILEDGVERSDIEAPLGRLLDDIEARIAEDQVMGGPPKGNA